MITLYQYPPALGIPSGSPFCVKTEILLKMAGVDYNVAKHADPRKAPRGKLPYIVDSGRTIADSEHIRFHLEETYNAKLDEGLTDLQRAQGHALARMIEERLYWGIVYFRWIDDKSWPHVRETFFASVPAIIRPVIAGMVRKQVRGALYGHGLGRHSPSEIERLCAEDLKSIAIQLDYKPYVMGDKPTTADATVGAFLAAILLCELDSPLKRAADSHEVFGPYVERIMSTYFPK